MARDSGVQSPAEPINLKWAVNTLATGMATTFTIALLALVALFIAHSQTGLFWGLGVASLAAGLTLRFYFGRSAQFSVFVPFTSIIVALIGIVITDTGKGLYVRPTGLAPLFGAYQLNLMGSDFASSKPPAQAVRPPLASAIPDPEPAPPPPVGRLLQGIDAPSPAASVGITGRAKFSEAPTLPSFPWPPPAASGRVTLNPELFAGSETLGKMANRLTTALDTGTYEYSFLGAPAGFVIVSRIERIEDDGTSMAVPLRWSLDVTQRGHSVSDILHGPFSAPEGYFRVLAFIVTDVPFGLSDNSVTSGDTLSWLRSGFNKLPEEVAAKPRTPSTQCIALIYEFKGQGFDRKVEPLVPGRFDGYYHLTKSGILLGLGGR